MELTLSGRKTRDISVCQKRRQNMDKIKVAGYVKLAKWWDKQKDRAIPYHEEYYRKMFDGSEVFELVGVYIDITGNKDIYKRTEMIRLIRDCVDGKVDCIATLTKGYLARNMQDFSYLFKYLMDARDGHIDFITEDENDKEDHTGFYIDTIKNVDDQKGALREMVEQFASLYPKDYQEWKGKVDRAIDNLQEGREHNG